MEKEKLSANPYQNIAHNPEKVLSGLKNRSDCFEDINKFIQLCNNFPFHFLRLPDGSKPPRFNHANESRYYREFENTYPALNGRIVQKYVDDPTLGPGIEFTKDKQLTEDLFEAYKIMFALITEEDLRAYQKAEGGSSGIDYLGKNFLLTA